jgi:hypothetical protein
MLLFRRLLEGSIPPELSYNCRVLEKTLAHTPCGNLQTLPSVEFPSTLCTPAAAVSQCFTQVHNPETSLGLHTPCTAPVPNCTFERMRTKATLSEPFVNALLARQFDCTPCRNPCSDRETIETHSYFLSDFKLKHEIIYTTYKTNV